MSFSGYTLIVLGGVSGISSNTVFVTYTGDRFTVSKEDIKKLNNVPSWTNQGKQVWHYGSSAVVDPSGRFVYVIGGSGSLFTSPAKKLDTQTLSWSDIPSLITERYFPCAFIINDMLYTIGGMRGSNFYYSDMESLDLKNPQSVWKKTSQNFPVAAAASASCVMNSWVWISGGLEGANKAAISSQVNLSGFHR